MEQSATSSTSPNAVRVGNYALELTATAETFVLFKSRREETNASNLAAALGSAAPDPNASAATSALDKVVEDASVVTARSECGRARTAAHLEWKSRQCRRRLVPGSRHRS